MFEGFWFANALKGLALNGLDQSVDTIEDFTVAFLPVEVILPGVGRKNEPHSSSSRV
jgi:hypothetical protein